MKTGGKNPNVAEANRRRVWTTEMRTHQAEGSAARVHSQETRDKIAASNRGEKSSQWKGGIYPLSRALRKCARMTAWRLAVFERDGYADVVTGCVGGSLEAHHITPFHTLLEIHNIRTLDDAFTCDALWDVDNGITLSRKTHKELHDIIGWK